MADLTASAQNYLKVVWVLGEWSDEPVTAGRLASRQGLRVSSVSDGVRRLTEQGLLEHAPYGAITLTAEGRRHAVAMVRRHRIIETFLVVVLGYTWDEVHAEADVLEHAVSDVMVERMDEVLGRPRVDPHGDPIPSADGQVHLPRAVPLVELAPGVSGSVVRVSDADPLLLRHLAERGLVPGARLEVRAGAPFSGDLPVLVGDAFAEVVLDRRGAAASVWVTPAT